MAPVAAQQLPSVRADDSRRSQLAVFSVGHGPLDCRVRTATQSHFATHHRTEVISPCVDGSLSGLVGRRRPGSSAVPDI
jgi:hypothetical protein